MMNFKHLLKSWLLIALGVLIASNIFSGIHYTDMRALTLAVVLLSLSNVFLKPLLMLFALPFIVLSFGLGIWLINALLFLLVGQLVEGFVVDSFGYALAGALLVSLTGAAANILLGTSRVRVRSVSGRASASGPSPQAQKPIKDDDVIDI
ncbi:MAG: phage holin family protein [Opitutales bacterium]